jgi:acetyltransferase-like isoleucine patch superfamily enzyme
MHVNLRPRLLFFAPVFKRCLAIIYNLHKFFSQLEWMVRCFLWNRYSEIYVSKQCFITKTVKLQLKPGGIYHGGQIHISANVCLTDGVIIAPYGGSIHIGENVFLGPYCVLYGHGGLTIGKDTLIAAHSVIIPSNHGFADQEKTISIQPSTNFGITIGEDVWIGCGVKILDGVSIGKGCVVGAGAVVNKSLPDYSIAVGIPAKIIGKRGDALRDSRDNPLIAHLIKE